MYLFFVSVVFLCYFTGAITVSEVPEVSTPLGNVQGLWKTSYNGRHYAAFEGIPFAKPPVGELRFEEPQPVEPWPGVWNASRLYTCLQSPFYPGADVTGSEDCLYVNVYVPVTDAEELPVVVHIHGGGFIAGSGASYTNPKYVVDRDVIFVTFNYRLGALGFASTEDEVLPGNNGLKDQVLALKWVQENINSFGGNPSSVTLTGFSAGAGSAHLHYFSPLSKGLFHRGMSVSGTAASEWSVTENAAENVNKLGSLVGCPTTNTNDLVECLKSRPAELLVRSVEHVFHFARAPLTIFGPVVDRKSKNPFLSKSPVALLRDGQVADVPWITSVARDDGLGISALFFNEFEAMNERWEEVGSYVLLNQKLLNRKDALNKIREFYFGKHGEISLSNLASFSKMLTDFLFLLDAEIAVKLQSKAVKSPIYFYLFNYDKGENSFLDDFLLPKKEIAGVSHGDDMIYFFGGLITKTLSESDVRLKDKCLDMLYSYAKDGIPSFKGIDWKPVNGEEFIFLNITGPEDINLQTSTDISFAAAFYNELGLSENVRDEL